MCSHQLILVGQKIDHCYVFGRLVPNTSRGEGKKLLSLEVLAKGLLLAGRVHPCLLIAISGDIRSPPPFRMSVLNGATQMSVTF